MVKALASKCPSSIPQYLDYERAQRKSRVCWSKWSVICSYVAILVTGSIAVLSSFNKVLPQSLEWLNPSFIPSNIWFPPVLLILPLLSLLLALRSRAIGKCADSIDRAERPRRAVVLSMAAISMAVGFWVVVGVFILLQFVALAAFR